MRHWKLQNEDTNSGERYYHFSSVRISVRCQAQASGFLCCPHLTARQDDALGERHGRSPHKQSSKTGLAIWAQVHNQAPSSITGCFLSSPYLCLQPTLWPFEIKAPRLASAPTPSPDSPVCLEDRALGKKWGLYKVGSSCCADGKTEVWRSCPRIQNHTQW